MKKVISPAAGSHSYTPGNTPWHNPVSGNTGGGIYTMAKVHIANTNTVVAVFTELAFNSLVSTILS